MHNDNAPSRYHHVCFVGEYTVHQYIEKGLERLVYDDERIWCWNSMHPDLEPTSTFKVGYEDYCSYCCQPAYVIQNKRYTVVGYTCICEQAELEKGYRKAQEQLKIKHQTEEIELKKQFIPKLLHDDLKRAELEHEYRIKDIKNHHRIHRNSIFNPNYYEMKEERDEI